MDYGLTFQQEIRLDYTTTYDLSVWVRGIDLRSGVNRPWGYGGNCGLFFWVIGPSGDPATRVFPSEASPGQDGTTGWALRTMRFTTPPRSAFTDAAPDADTRLRLQLRVQLYGSGTIQVDDLRVAPSQASPPSPRRLPGHLSLIAPEGKPLFGMGLFRLPDGLTWRKLASEQIFNFSGGAGPQDEKRTLGVPSMLMPTSLDPACRGCGSASADSCTACRGCPDEPGLCGAYSPPLLQASGSFLVWLDEENTFPDYWGSLQDMVEASRRIRQEVAKLRPGRPVYMFISDMPGAVYFNTYGWDDLARYHASEAFDIVATIRRGGNPPAGALGSLMSEFPQTSINGIRRDARRLADDVSDSLGRQYKSVWMLVNGGSHKILTDRSAPGYRFAPHDQAQLLAMRPSHDQLRYMLYAAILNGVTGLLFYQDVTDTPLTRNDPYWKQVLLPAAAELATLEKQTGFLTESEYNAVPYRLTGDAGGVDSMLKEVAGMWILVVANSSPSPATGVELRLEAGWRIEGGVERLSYRHEARVALRKIEAAGWAKGDAEGFPLDLPGYGVGLYRFKILEPADSTVQAPASQ